MPEFKRILFPVDFSDRCRGAARYATATAERFRSELLLLHVVETPIARPGELDFGALAFESDLEARVESTRERLGSFLEPDIANLRTEFHIEQGDPARTIVRFAKENRVDLILMPTHGYGAFRRFILGSVTAKVLHDADCPVWTGVHMESAPDKTAVTYRRILCAVDIGESAIRPLHMASDFANEYGAELTVAHAVPSSEVLPERYLDNEFRQQLAEDARNRLRSQLRELGIDADVCVEGGEVAKVVHLAARSHNADLVVIGRGGHPGLVGRLRTHSYAIIRDSPCPVISV